MNIVCRCVDPGPGPPHPLLGSVHFCGILYLFEIPSVWSMNTGACKRALKPCSTPPSSRCRLTLMVPPHSHMLKKSCFASPFTQFVSSFKCK